MNVTCTTIAAAIALSLASTSPLIAAGGCLVDGQCSQLSAAQCANAGGTFLGEGVSCASTGCGALGAGSCFQPHATNGCSIASCCFTVCEVDPFCCANEWDSVCAEAAAAECAGCGSLQAGSCFEPNGSSGCELLECCTAICAVDQFCCDQLWDQLCADQAIEACGSCGGALAGDCFESNNTPGCNSAPCCEIVCAADSFCCDTFWDQLCADRAAQECGFCGAPGAGECVSANGTPFCNDLGCCAEVCLIDSFCCQTAWDQACANEAAEICCLAPCTGDLDGNGVVDGGDLGVLLGAFGGSDSCADFDGNGAVNGADLGILLGAWGPCVN